MSDVFISYARSTEVQAQAAAEALRTLGYSVWLDDELLAHHAYTRVIDEQLTVAKAALVIWSAEAVKSDWVLSEANRAREDHKLVQLTVDGARLPMPFDQTQCADLQGWSGDTDAPGWRKVVASVAELISGEARAPDPGATAAVLPLPSKPSIAVMPFANLSGDPEQDYFADGMVEEIVAALSRCKSIFVIGSGSTFAFKGRTVRTQDVGRQLGVRYVLEGSVRKAANRVRIAVRLTEASDGSQIWADRFEDTLDDVFALQDKVALSVAGVIEPTVREAEIRRVSTRPTGNMGSYDLYLRAQALTASSDPADFPAAIALLEQAIELDPDFGPALAEAAALHTILSLSPNDSGGHREKGGALLQRALQVAGDDPAVLGAVATANMILGRDAAQQLALIERALAMNPGSAASWANSGRLRVALGEPDLAVEHIETAMRLDPLSSSRSDLIADLGSARLLQRRFDEAIILLRQSIELHPTFAPAQAWLASALGHAGRLEEAQATLREFREADVGTLQGFAERRFRTPETRRFFLDGIAMAEGLSPPR